LSVENILQVPQQDAPVVQVTVLAEIATARSAQAQSLLLPAEHKALEAALDMDDSALRACACMAAAARFASHEAAYFWTQLPATLAAHSATITERTGKETGSTGGRSMQVRSSTPLVDMPVFRLIAHFNGSSPHGEVHQAPIKKS
jgi:hypothetical protein